MAFIAHAVQLQRAETLKVIQEAIVLSMGGTIKKPNKKRKSKKGQDPAERERMKLLALKQMGIDVGPQPK